MKIVKANAQGIKLAVQYLRAGKAVVYPTDTAYGLGVDAGDAAAVRKLYKIKGRNYKKPTHVIVHNLSAAEKWTIVDRTARGLMKKFWPGAVTVVLPLKLQPLSNSPLARGEGKTKTLPPLERGGRKGEVETALKLISAGTGTIGVRMPDNKMALALVKKFGRPVTTPSANPQGGPAPYSIQDSLRQFKNRKYQPDLYLDAGKLPKRPPSTIIKIMRHKIKIFREGSVNPLSISPLRRGRKRR